jgi:predicted ribosomally synthesized peptide with SipW-like signal peptide
MNDDTFGLSRRQVLGALGTIGVASAGAGLGTSAYFSDQETFENNQLTAGELDLKLDWEEHYSDWSADESEGVGEVAMTDGDQAAVPDGYVGLPDPAEPLIAVPEEGLGAFMTNTAVEAYPDVDGEGARSPPEGYEACADGADVPDDLDPTASLRTRNEDTYDEETGTKPLIDLGDVKPGDFGELTLGFELCDNPGYVWLTGRNVEASENGVTEPEADDEGEGSGVELLDEIRTVWWYDDGDNVLRNPCDRAPETLYLSDSGTDPTTLFTVELVDADDGAPLRAELTEVWPTNGGDGDFGQTDAIATTPDGETVYFYDKDSGHLGAYDVSDGSFEDRGAVAGDPGGVVLAAFSPDGTLWAASQDTDELYTVDVTSPSLTSQGETGIDLMGADIALAADGSLFIWTSSGADEGLYRVSDPAIDATAVPVDASNVGSIPESITGLAVRDAGTGAVVASERENDEIVTVDRTDGTIDRRYPMRISDGDGGFTDYSYDYGDMTVGALCEQVFRRGTLGEDLAALSSGQGIPLDGALRSDFDELGGADVAGTRECFSPGGTHHVGFAWYLPADVGNEVQSDSVTFDLGFYTEQCRHNDGEGMPDES